MSIQYNYKIVTKYLQLYEYISNSNILIHIYTLNLYESALTNLNLSIFKFFNTCNFLISFFFIFYFFDKLRVSIVFEIEVTLSIFTYVPIGNCNKTLIKLLMFGCTIKKP